MSIDDDAFWIEAREELDLAPSEIYLNAGSFSPAPRPARQAAQRWREELSARPMRALIDTMPRQLIRARQSLADYLDADSRSLLLLPNVTHAMNLAVASLQFPPGSAILTTDHEYGAMKHCLTRAAAKNQWSIDVAALPANPTDPQELIDAIERHGTERTKALFFSHVVSPTGIVLPARALCALAAERGWLSVVDGAHAPGMIPLSVREIGADFYGGNGHKWMMAPVGVGFLNVSDRCRASLEPLVTSWGWEFNDDASDEESGWGASKWALRNEFMGTADRSAQLVLPEVIAFRHRLTDEAVRERSRSLVGYTRQEFERLGWTARTPADPRLSGSMVAFDAPTVDVVRAREWMFAEHRISIPFTQIGHETFLRVSCAWFNQHEEIEFLVSILPTIPWDEWRP